MKQGELEMEGDETVALLGPAPPARRGGKQKRMCCQMMLVSTLLAVAVISAVVIATTYIIGSSNAVAKMGNKTRPPIDCTSYSSWFHSPQRFLSRGWHKLSKAAKRLWSFFEARSSEDEKDCTYCSSCTHCPQCYWCDKLGCAINANCKFCPKCKNCMSDGFCGKLCKMKNLPKQIQLYGQTC